MTVDWSNVKGKPPCFTPCSHNHDDRYYTKAQIDVMIGLSAAYWVDTQVELALIPAPATQTFRILRGLNAVGDGQIVMVIWQSWNTDTEDGIDTFRPFNVSPASPGRWVRFQI